MALKNILVHLDSGTRSAVRLQAAAALARRHEAHLTGLAVIDIPSVDFFYGSAMPFAGTGPEDVVERMRADAMAAMEPVEARFRERLRLDGLQGEWRLVESHLPATMPLHARYADLTVLGQPNRYEPQENVGMDAMVANTIMTSGRPVLAVPFAGEFPLIGERVLVAWNASREAARAVNDALPLLEAAK
ncbi:MAG: universal stress protein, partial [Rhodospirillales bacterium]|nr:universal stress protein [Rhodospirillales bacterium]